MNQLPEAFLHQIKQLIPHEADAFLEALSKPANTSIRLNPIKPITQFDDELPIQWCSTGRLLKNRPSFIADPLFHAGAYYVQESSSMFLYHIYHQLKTLLPTAPVVLDLCAAPGGKTTLLASCMENKGLLVSNEVIQSRVKVLTENVEKWGCSNIVVTNNDPKEFETCKEIFDLVVVDAPCSGEGMFRKDAQAIKEWSEENVTLCHGRQERILKNIIGAIKPGGFLVYSTCTFNTQENEAQVKWLQENFGFKSIQINHLDASIEEVTSFEGTPLFAYRFYLHRVNGEGLFMCCLQKPGLHDTPFPVNARVNELPKNTLSLLDHWVNQSDTFNYQLEGNQIMALPLSSKDVFKYLSQRLKVVRAGVLVGELMKNELIPNHALALSSIVNSQIPRTALSILEARKYLMKDVLPVGLFEQTGWQLVTYQNYPLGWVKVLANRVNNYFPTYLRVLKNIQNETT